MGGKILIVEDELDLLDLVDFNLTRKGFLTTGVLNGAEAFEMFNAFGPDVVILDLMLPGLDGWELCRRIKESGSPARVLMLTAKCMDEDRQKGLNAGADDYMTKPFNVRELIVRVDRLAEEKRQTDFKRMLLHEMSNRLSTIGCFTELISQEDDGFTPKKSFYTNKLAREVGYANEVFSELGALVDMESAANGRAEKCGLEKLLQGVAASYQNLASHKEISVEAVSEENLHVNADPRFLRQVFLNLVGNAIKYTGRGGRVEVCARSIYGGAVATVRDTGCGIPQGEISRIFEKGFRASNVRDTVKGSGLGLYIVKMLLERMRAEIHVESKPGEGSEFIIFFRN